MAGRLRQLARARTEEARYGLQSGQHYRLVPHWLRRNARRALGPGRYHRLFPGEQHWAVGGLWGEQGPLQFEFLRSQGLRPEHDFLDVGCGALRGGVHFIRYLEPGRYCGLDISADLIEAGRVELERGGLADRGPNLHVTDTFDAGVFGRQFEFALAQSVFTHVPLNSVLVALRQVEEVLAPGGRFFATFLENAEGTKVLKPITWEQPDIPAVVSHPDRDPYHYGYDAFEWLCDGTRLRPELIGDWGSLRGQQMLMFTRE